MKILTAATKSAKWMAYLGLVCGVLYSVGGFFVDLFTRGLNLGTLMAFGALVGMPAISAAFGFVGGALIALLVRGATAARDRLGQ
jgi:hypothetical protein